jgi:phosphate transport system permease protein
MMRALDENRFIILKKSILEKLAVFLLVILFIIFMIIFFFFIGIILVKGQQALSFSFLTDSPSDGMSSGGIFPAIIGTMMLALFSAVFCVPFGVISGIYLSEYSKQGKFTYYTKLAIKNLAGVPSVVYGLFGMALFLHVLGLKKSILAAGLTLGILTLPIVIISTVDAISSVPFSLRQASLGLGANKWQTIYKVVFPTAVPGVLTGCLLAITRAIGETAPLLFTGVVYYSSSPQYSVDSQFMSLSFHIFALVTQHPDINKVTPIAFGAAFILLIMVFILSLITVYIRYRYSRKKS